MKLAVVSDIHFGDSECSLVSKQKGQWTLNQAYYDKFLDCLKDQSDQIGSYQYLLMLGDIFDLAVSNDDNTFKAAKPFFQRLKADNLFQEILVTIGNHDHDLWSNLQYENCIVKKLRAHEDPVSRNWTIPLLIDNRNHDLALSDTGYCNSFIDDLTEPATKFRVVAPNIYLVDNQKTILFTHGQYFDAPWSFLGQLSKIMFRKDLDIIPLTRMQHILGDNFMTNQLICSGLGQAEVNFTQIIQNLEHDFKNHRYGKVIEYIWNLLVTEGIEKDLMIIFLVVVNAYFLNKILSCDRSVTPEHFEEYVLSGLESKIAPGMDMGDHKKMIKEAFSYLKNHLDTSPAKQNERVMNYYTASLAELRDMTPGVDSIDYIIFGHTHDPKPWTGKKINWSDFDESTAPNTGAWLHKGNKGFCGANVFVYDSTTQDITYKTIAPSSS